jgi:UDP-glucose 4-epimerase
MKVLVTGAAGQVGCRLVRQLLERNHEVRGTILPQDPCRERLAGVGLELIEGDLTDEAFVKSAVEGVEGVIHTANFVGPQFDNNLQINRLVARICGEQADALDRLVYVSSSGVFPNNSGVIACAYHPVDELHPKRPDSEYGLSKLIGEEFVNLAALQTGLRTAIVRPAHVLSGTDMLSRFTVEWVCQVLRTGQANRHSALYMSDGTELWHPIEEAATGPDQPCSVCDLDGRPWYYQPNDARDIAHCLVCALEEDAAIGESFNVGGPVPFTYPEGAQLTAAKTGRDLLEIRLPVRWRYDHDITRAKSWIGYRPRGDLETMMESAWLFADGKEDYTWEGAE